LRHRDVMPPHLDGADGKRWSSDGLAATLPLRAATHRSGRDQLA